MVPEAAKAETRHGRALVLGGGGVAGIAWEAGLVSGLQSAGVDLADADLFVGTSAGSVVASFLAHGAEPSEAVKRMAEETAAAQAAAQNAARAAAGAAEPVTVPGGSAGPELNAIIAAFGVLFDPSLDPRQARARVGRMALDAAVDGRGDRLRAIGDWLPADEWPSRPLLVTAVDTADGEFVVWDHESSVPLSLAVMSSCAVPMVFPPVEINGGRYMDGGTRSVTNADLAKGASAVVVLEPMAHLSPRAQAARELAELGTDAVVAIAPDQNAIEVFGLNVLDDSLWGPAFEAGTAQAPAVAEQVAAVWNGR